MTDIYIYIYLYKPEESVRKQDLEELKIDLTSSVNICSDPNEGFVIFFRTAQAKKCLGFMYYLHYSNKRKLSSNSTFVAPSESILP